MVLTTGTTIEVLNDTQSDTIVTCSSVENYDFDGVGRPDKQFDKVKIKARGTASRHVELKDGAKKCPFRMTLNFNGYIDEFKVNQKSVCCKSTQVDYREIHNCGRHEYDCVNDREKKTLFIKIKDSIPHLQQLLQDYLDKMKKQRKYKEAIEELQKKLNSSAAKDSAAYREALQSAIDDLKKDQQAYEALNEANKLANAKEYGKALAKLKEAEKLARDSDLQRDISIQTENILKQEQNAKAQNLLKEADELAKQKKYTESLKKYAEAQCYAQSDDLMNQISEKARQCKENMNNEHAKELQAEGNKARSQGDFEGARAQYEQASHEAVDGKLRDSIKEDIEKSFNMQATSIKKEAGVLINQGNTAEAMELYEKCLGYAKDGKLINGIKEDMLAIGDDFATKLQNAANKENDFVKRLDQLLEAKRYAKNLALIQLIDNDIQIAYNKEVIRIQNEATNLIKQGKFEEGDQLFDKALSMARDPKTRQSILLDKMNALKKHTELTQESGQKLASQNKYEAALAKFSEATAAATNGADLMSIIKDKTKALDKQNEMLQKQTKEMIGQNQYDECKALLEEVMKHTTDSRQMSIIVKCQTDIATNQIAFLQSEANKLANQNKFKEANDILDQAQSNAVNYEKTRSIDADRAKILNKQASYLVQEEIDFADEAVENRLTEVEQLYLTAQRLYPSKDLRKNLKALNYIKEGSRYLKEAIKLNNEANTLLKTAQDNKTINLDEVENKCRDATELIARAEYSFNEGTKINQIFKDSVDAASDEKKIVNNISGRINSLRVQRNNNKLKDEKLKLAFEEKYVEEKNMQEQREREVNAADMEAKLAQPVLVIDS